MRPRSPALLAAVMLAATSCAHSPARGPLATAPAADSATIVLWRFDESGGDRVADAGGYRFDGVAGVDTRTDFGRYGNARVFNASIESFAFLPYHPELETPGEIAVEAWVYVNEYGAYEDTPIAARWTELSNDQSWILSIVGAKIDPVVSQVRSPGLHRSLVQLGSTGHLMFAIQPEGGNLPVAYFSTFQVERERWTHVAASFDGELVKLFVDGRLDAQYAVRARIRPSHAPLLVGNYFDPRWLTDFGGGTLRVGAAIDRTPYYAFQGMIDELRISSRARTALGTVAP